MDQGRALGGKGADLVWGQSRFMDKGRKRRKCQALEWRKGVGGEELRSRSRENFHKMAIDFRRH